jgi:hypothetical protein
MPAVDRLSIPSAKLLTQVPTVASGKHITHMSVNISLEQGIQETFQHY